MLKLLFCSSLISLSFGPAGAQTENAAPAAPKAAATPPSSKTAATPLLRSPRQLFPGLFEAVQLGRVFADNKTFVDAAPRQAPAALLAAWQREKVRPDFRLRAFVESHFDVPTSTATAFQTNQAAGLRHHLDTLWTVLARPAAPTADSTNLLAQYRSLVPLPHSYLVPGGRFREVYYWDSYFTMLGLAEANKTQLLREITDNFAYLLGRFGFVPNGNRTYYLTRS